MAQPNGRLFAETFTRSMEAGLGSTLELLLQAHECAADARAERWNFAVEIQTLPEGGFVRTLLRWLISKDLVEHRCETTTGGDPARNFAQPLTPLVFSEKSCFVLTNAGAEYAREFLAARAAAEAALRPETRQRSRARYISLPEPLDAHSEPVPPAAANAQPAAGSFDPPSVLPEVPCWDPDRKELTFRGVLIKRFRLPSPNQETVLMAFQEDGWPVRIDDPLPPSYQTSTKSRLHDTIKNLNRHQKTPLIRFCGDGTGEGVRWEVRDPEEEDNGT